MNNAQRIRTTTKAGRDAGLRKIGAITRWTVAGALAGTGLFAGLAAQSAHGATAAATASKATGTAGVASQQSSVRRHGDDGGGSNQFTPATAPTVQPAPNGSFAPIVSGAS